MASIWTSHLHGASSFPVRNMLGELQLRSSQLGLHCKFTSSNRKVTYRKYVVKASLGSDDDKSLQNDVVSAGKIVIANLKKHQENIVAKFQESVSSVPSVKLVFPIRRFTGANITIGICIVATMFVVVVRAFNARKSRDEHVGSVADLVRRGQLRSDRRGISTPLKYEDPFNNPMVKVSKNNSSVEMCGKIYRLTPVLLTDELQTVHQKRRSRAYQWKRPTIFLKEGEPVPPDVDPDTVRWIPANHPFATTSSDIDEDLAQNNVNQKHGVPFRIKAEHEALQRKLEALQNDQKLSKLVIDPAAARDFERPLKTQLKSENQVDYNTSNPKVDAKSPPSDCAHNPFGNSSPPEEMQTPS